MSVLRLIAEGQTSWSFLPPTSSQPSPATSTSAGSPERGIWLGTKPNMSLGLASSSSGSEDGSTGSAASGSFEDDSDASKPDELGAMLDALNVDDSDSEDEQASST